MYASSSSALTTGSAITFDGTNLGVGTTSPSSFGIITAKKDQVGDTAVTVSNQGTPNAVTTMSFSLSEAGTPGGWLRRYRDGTGNVEVGFDTSLLFTGNVTSTKVVRFQMGPAGQLGIGGATYGSAGQVLTSGGSSAAPTWSTPASGVSLSADNTWTGTQTFQGTASKLSAIFTNIAELATVVASQPSVTADYYITQQSVVYFTANAANNWAFNFIGNSGVTLNSVLSTGQSITVAALVTNGGTAYYNTSVQVDGTTSGVTTKWQGGTAPTSGNANSIDVYTYTIIKTASATYTVFASQTKFA
jgi:hypothetical protein